MMEEKYNEALFRNMTDREYIRYVLSEHADNFHAVQMALRLEDLIDAVEGTDG